MRVVLDTNVLISAIFFPGAPSRILSAWIAHQFDLVVSTEILEEHREVARRIGARFPGVELGPVLDRIALHALLVVPAQLPDDACADPDDVKFLEAALGSGADCVASGDRALLRTMLLTITTTHRPATDLGYLLHKSPNRVHTFEMPFGPAHVFYPEAMADRCTAALLLEVDPVGLVRDRKGPAGAQRALEQYVNDRPYVASSFLSVVLSRVLGFESTTYSRSASIKEEARSIGLSPDPEFTSRPKF